LHRRYQYVIFILVSLISFSFYYLFIDLPDKTLSVLSIVILLTYPWWRRNVPTPYFSTYLLYIVTSFWLYEAWYRLENSLLISNRYYSDIPPKHVDFDTALLGAIPFIVVALVLLIDELFIPRPKIKYFYNVDSLNTENLETRRQSMLKILADRNIMQLYSKDGLEKAKMDAKKLHIDQNKFIFATKEEIDAQMKESINIATLDKP